MERRVRCVELIDVSKVLRVLRLLKKFRRVELCVNKAQFFKYLDLKKNGRPSSYNEKLLNKLIKLGIVNTYIYCGKKIGRRLVIIPMSELRKFRKSRVVYREGDRDCRLLVRMGDFPVAAVLWHPALGGMRLFELNKEIYYCFDDYLKSIMSILPPSLKTGSAGSIPLEQALIQTRIFTSFIAKYVAGDLSERDRSALADEMHSLIEEALLKRVRK